MGYTTRNSPVTGISEPPARTCVIKACPDLTGDNEINAVLIDTRAGLDRQVHRIRVDLTGVRVANSKVIACLVLLRRLSRTAGATMEILASETVVTWVELYHVEWVLRRGKSDQLSAVSQTDH